jgi:predicted RNase H-like HicB family nuclease
MTLEKTYTFKIIVEPDEDRWFAYSPALEELGGATWGFTKEEALKHIDEVVHMVIEGLIEDGIPIPIEPEDAVQVSEEPAVSVIA